MMTKLCAVLIVSILGTPVLAADLAGAWSLLLDPDLGGVRSTVPCTFKQAGEKLTIICNGDTAAPIFGEVKGRTVTFRLITGLRKELTATHTGQLDRQATTIKGTWHLISREDKKLSKSGKFAAVKQ